MKLKDGSISFLVGQDSTTIEIHDSIASVTLARVTLTPKQLSQALSRLAYTHCDVEVNNLDKVGKKMINKKFEFELPNFTWGESKQCAIKTIKDVCPEGWKADNYFNSQDSFFNKDGKQYARVTIRKWIIDNR